MPKPESTISNNLLKKYLYIVIIFTSFIANNLLTLNIRIQAKTIANKVMTTDINKFTSLIHSFPVVQIHIQ